MLPDLTLTRGYSEDDLAFWMITARIFGLIAAFVGGFSVDRWGFHRSISFGLIVCGLLTSLMGLVSPSTSMILYCFQTILAVALTPIIHTLIPHLAPPGKNAEVVSLVASLGFVAGSGILPKFLGLLGDLQIYYVGFLLFGFLSTVGGFVLARRGALKDWELKHSDVST